MIYPEHRDIIVFDDSVFEIGDIVRIALRIQGIGQPEEQFITGRITNIDNEGFSVDVSEQYCSCLKFLLFKDVKMICQVPRKPI